MKLSIFSTVTLPKFRASKNLPGISVSSNGQIILNALLVQMVGLKNGTKICFAQEDVSRNWYFYIDEKNGYEFYSKKQKKGGETLRFTHKELVQKMFGEANKIFNCTVSVDRNPLIQKIESVTYEFWHFFFEPKEKGVKARKGKLYQSEKNGAKVLFDPNSAE